MTERIATSGSLSLLYLYRHLDQIRTSLSFKSDTQSTFVECIMTENDV